MIPHYLTSDRDTLESECRQRYQTAYLGPELMLCRVLGRYLMYTNPRDVDLTPHMCLDGFWEPWITLAVARCLKPGMFCLDIGANHGYYTLLMADAVGEQGRVLALEPNTKVAELVRLSTHVNGFDSRVDVIDKAAADSSGRLIELVIPHRHLGRASICRRTSPNDPSTTVETITVDDAVSQWPRVDLIKIDAEGAEPEIWEGMRETLANNPQLIVFLELTPTAYANPSDFLERVQSLDYPLRYIDADGLSQPITPEELLAPDDHPPWWMLCLAKD